MERIIAEKIQVLTAQRKAGSKLTREALEGSMFGVKFVDHRFCGGGWTRMIWNADFRAWEVA